MARRLLLALGGTTALALCGCPDFGEVVFERAVGEHRALVRGGVDPRRAEFDAVLEDLDKVPASSRYAPEARRLAAAIRSARAPAPAPLAVVPARGTRGPELEAQLARCARLAASLGADGGVDRAGREALEACRRQAEVLDIRDAHGDEPHEGALTPGK